MENSHLERNFLIFLILSFVLDSLKALVSNAQVNLNVERRQLPGNGAKNLLEKSKPTQTTS